jgi:asparagine synthase (glutamine-hydrolysing)
MAHGLEVRVPMLGNAVADLVLGLPARIHFDPDGKALLRGLARRHLPESVWNRPKHGFSVPIGEYFRGAWKPAGDALLGRCGERAPFLNPAAVAGLWNAAREGKASRRLAYSFLVLLAWLDCNPVEA